MIKLRFVKLPYCGGVLHQYQNSSLLHRIHNRTNEPRRIVEKKVSKSFDKPSYSRNLSSTALPEVHVKLEDAPSQFVHVMDTKDVAFSNQLRNLLYSENEDQAIVNLKLCTSDNEVYNIINQFEHPDVKYLVQALLVLRDLHINDVLYPSIIDLDMKTNPSFMKLVEQIINSISQLNIDELSSTILYLSKFDLEEEKLRLLISAYEDRIGKMDSTSISVLSLTQVCVALDTFHNLWSMNTLVKFIPLISEKIGFCDNYKDFRRLTRCCQKIRFILSRNSIEQYVERCSILMQKNEDTASEIDRLRAVLRCVQLLNSRPWQCEHSKLINDLLLTMEGSIHLLPVRHVYLLHSTVFGLQEPQQILKELKSLVNLEFSQGTMKEKLSAGAAMDLRTAFLLYTNPGEKNPRKSECLHALHKYLDCVDLDNEFQLDYLLSLLKTVNSLKNCDLLLADKFWHRASKFLNRKECRQPMSRVVDACSKYVSYKSLSNYSNSTFETCASTWLKEIAEENKSVLRPNMKCSVELLSLYFSFDLERFGEVCKYYIDNISRFELAHLDFMSFLFRAIKSKFRESKKSSPFLYYYIKVLSAFNNAAIEFLKNEKDLEIHDLILLFRIYSYADGLKSTELYRLIIDRLNQVPTTKMNSKKILSIIPTSFVSHLFEPRLVDKMVQYFLEQQDVVSTYSTIQLLKYAYSFGYTPQRCEEFIDLASRMVIEDKDELSAYYVIFAALSLCYYNRFPRELSDYIFNVEFLDYIDTETISMNYKRRQTFRTNLLELNRAACLDFPSSDLPWFHENYCKEKFSLKSNYKSGLQREIMQKLYKLIHNDKALEIDSNSPYYHFIDFVLYTNKNGEPIDPSKCNPQDLRKIAILTNPNSSSSYYVGKGNMDMKIRQLELLNYKVAVIDGHLWNSMHMAEPTAKENYLCDAIWSK